MAERKRGKAVKEQLLDSVVSVRGVQIVSDIKQHFDLIHSVDQKIDKTIEFMVLEDERLGIINDMSHLNFERGLVTFSPSSASKCERELFYKANRYEQDEMKMYPYHRRWTRNGSAVHAAVQKDLLYGELMEGSKFKVVRTKDERPAWEKNIRYVRQFEHNGVRFQLYGMMDGVLIYTPDGTKLGFEFKTKSTTLGAIGDYKMKDAQDSHKEQCVAYSLLFGLREFVIMYETLAKDGWMKNEEAKSDIRPFYFQVTDEMRTKMLDKFATVAKQKYDEELPAPNFEKCIFCPYKSSCAKDEQRLHGTGEEQVDVG